MSCVQERVVMIVNVTLAMVKFKKVSKLEFRKLSRFEVKPSTCCLPCPHRSRPPFPPLEELLALSVGFWEWLFQTSGRWRLIISWLGTFNGSAQWHAYHCFDPKKVSKKLTSPLALQGVRCAQETMSWMCWKWLVQQWKETSSPVTARPLSISSTFSSTFVIYVVNHQHCYLSISSSFAISIIMYIPLSPLLHLLCSPPPPWTHLCSSQLWHLHWKYLVLLHYHL